MRKAITSINGSQSFVFKSRCKHCKSGPKYVYFILNKMVSTDSLYKIKDFYEKNVSSMRADDFYIEYSVKNRSFGPSYMFDPTSSALRKLPVPNMRYEQNEDRFNTMVECGCGQTSWGFVQSRRKHITGRKCRYDIRVKDVSSLYRIMI